MINEKGFTLIEMMIVLLIISILLIITVPNVAKHQNTIQEKGCEAYIHLVEGQVQAYRLEFGRFPVTVDELVSEGYITDLNEACGPDREISINQDGVVEVADDGPTSAS